MSIRETLGAVVDSYHERPVKICLSPALHQEFKTTVGQGYVKDTGPSEFDGIPVHLDPSLTDGGRLKFKGGNYEEFG